MFHKLKVAASLAIVPSILGSLCCAIPIILYFAGSQTPPMQLGLLGKHLYYDYGWYFRGFGLTLVTIASVLYWRRQGVTSKQMLQARRKDVLWLALVTLACFVVFYIASLAVSQYVGEWLGIYELWLTK